MSLINSRKNKSKGITLLETIVSLGILVIGVVASLSIATASLTFSQESEETLVVVSLAREGIEIVRTLRDRDGLPALPSSGSRIVDARYIFHLNYPTDSDYIDYCNNCRLYISNNVYNHTGGKQTNFRRMIKFYPVSDTERKVVSIVNWQERGRTHQFKLETYLTDWQ